MRWLVVFRNFDYLFSLLVITTVWLAACGQPAEQDPVDGGSECRLSTECADNNPCTDDICENGYCVNRTNQAPCTDGDACTVDDRCTGGICKGEPLDADGDGFQPDYCGGQDCDDSSNVVNPGVWEGPEGYPPCEDNIDNDCDGLTDLADNTCGTCVEDSDCDDNNLCTGIETCLEGACMRGESLVCEDDNPCTDDSCDPQLGCRNENNTDPCEDNNPCTSGDACQAGVCTGTLRDADGDDFVDEACGGRDCDDSRPDVNPGVFEGPHGGAPCSDSLDNDCDGLTDQQDNTCQGCDTDPDCANNDLCDGTEKCVDGSCQAGQELVCEDDNVCTDDSCDPELGCRYHANAALCEDGDVCTTGDTCQGGTCRSGTQDTCDDNNICTSDSCLAGVGCQHDPVSGSCQDGDPCTENDTCSAGTCQPGSQKTCDDSNPCTDDSCLAGSGCRHLPNTADCDDDDPCTQGDHCSGGTCVGNSNDCDDDNECTDDSCDTEGGCIHDFNQDPCNDGDPLTYNDTCVDGTCVGDSDNCAQWTGLSGQPLLDALFAAVDGHSALGYDSARYQIYSNIDNENGWVECAYTGEQVETWDIPDAEIMNIEHTWCQSWGSDVWPARSDINHLYPTMTVANSARSAWPFGWVVNATWTMGGSSLGTDVNGYTVFEPRDVQKGNTARSMFYFSIRYQMEIAYYMEPILREWNDQDPPDEKEILRNDAIEAIHGTRNPFVDCPGLVELVNDF